MNGSLVGAWYRFAINRTSGKFTPAA